MKFTNGMVIQRPGLDTKVEVEVDETDLLRILIENDINLPPERVPRKMVFVVLETEARKLLYAEAIQNHNFDPKEGAMAIRKCIDDQESTLRRIKGIQVDG